MFNNIVRTGSFVASFLSTDCFLGWRMGLPQPQVTLRIRMNTSLMCWGVKMTGRRWGGQDQATLFASKWKVAYCSFKIDSAEILPPNTTNLKWWAMVVRTQCVSQFMLGQPQHPICILAGPKFYNWFTQKWLFSSWVSCLAASFTPVVTDAVTSASGSFALYQDWLPHHQMRLRRAGWDYPLLSQSEVVHTFTKFKRTDIVSTRSEITLMELVLIVWWQSLWGLKNQLNSKTMQKDALFKSISIQD